MSEGGTGRGNAKTGRCKGAPGVLNVFLLGQSEKWEAARRWAARGEIQEGAAGAGLSSCQV